MCGKCSTNTPAGAAKAGVHKIRVWRDVQVRLGSENLREDVFVCYNGARDRDADGGRKLPERIRRKDLRVFFPTRFMVRSDAFPPPPFYQSFFILFFVS